MVLAFGGWLWDGSPGVAVSRWFILLSQLHICLCNSFHGCFVPNSKKGQSIHTWDFVLEIHVFCKLYLISWIFLVFSWFICLLDFLESTFLSSLYILDISPLSDLGLVKILSQSFRGLFFLSYWQCLLPYRVSVILWGPICKFTILQHKP